LHLAVSSRERESNVRTFFAFSQSGNSGTAIVLIWLDGLLRAHNKLASAFGKQPELKAALENECTIIKQLRSIKNEILYLKAQDLIKDKKLKRAIPLLVDIVCSEPNSALGQKAYQHLKQSGFSTGNNVISAKANEIKVPKER